MKFALAIGQRHQAQPNLSGKCPACGHPMVAKCGSVRVWHWAHQGIRVCDAWWEQETEWHRNWKGQFPETWQEIVFQAEDGEKHIADVRTDHGWVVEFQHSYIKPQERQSRDLFYRKLVWVVDAARRKTDAAQFTKAFEAGTPIGGNPWVRRVRPDECRLLQEWSGSPAPIFFDFGGGPSLWWLLARCPGEPMYVAPWSRATFIETHHGKGPDGARNFDEFATSVNGLVATYNAHLQSLTLERNPMQTNLARRRLRGRL